MLLPNDEWKNIGIFLSVFFKLPLLFMSMLRRKVAGVFWNRK